MSTYPTILTRAAGALVDVCTNTRRHRYNSIVITCAYTTNNDQRSEIYDHLALLHIIFWGKILIGMHGD